MMTFNRISACEVKPGALLMIDRGTSRTVLAIREITSATLNTVQLTTAEGVAMIRHNGEPVWVAQR